MAIFINGQKIAGRGADGDSAYAIAVKNGFTGTETSFNENLGRIDEIVSQAESAATRAENAKTAAEAVQNNLSNYATKSEVSNMVNQGIAAVQTGIWFYGPNPPSDTNLLWIDSSTTSGGLKFYVGTEWIHVPVAWK